MQYLKEVLTYVLYLFLVLLIGRMIFGWVLRFARDWRPTGVLLVLAETIYTLTDPPLNFLRRFIPPLPLGTLGRLDLSFTVLFIVVLILLEVAVPRI